MYALALSDALALCHSSSSNAGGSAGGVLCARSGFGLAASFARGAVEAMFSAGGSTGGACATGGVGGVSGGAAGRSVGA